MSEAEVMEAEQSELDSKPQANSLEGKVMEAAGDKISSSMDDNGSVYPTHNKERIYGQKGSAKSSKANYSASDAPIKHTGKSTDNGSVAFIYNEETGEVAFEQKPHDYFVKSERGKLQCTGGHVEEGEESLEAIIRELEEEAVNSSPVIHALKKKGYYHDTQKDEFDGKTVYTDFWVVPLSNKEWKNFVEGGLRGDAGPLRTMPLSQAYDLGSDFYAFKSGPIVKEIMGRIQPSRSTQSAPQGNYSLESLAYPINFTIAPVPIQNNYLIRTVTNN